MIVSHTATANARTNVIFSRVQRDCLMKLFNKLVFKQPICASMLDGHVECSKSSAMDKENINIPMK